MKKKEAQVLVAARDTLLKVAAERDAVLRERDALKMKLSQVRTRLECEKVAAEMHEKGLSSDRDFTTLVEDLEKAAYEGRLPIIQEAVKMSAPNMGMKIASINNDETSGPGHSQLEQFLVGSVG